MSRISCYFNSEGKCQKSAPKKFLNGSGKISQNFAKLNFLPKFCEIRIYTINFAKLNSLPKFRKICTYKFREINNVFREISYFAKLWKPTFVATLYTSRCD